MPRPSPLPPPPTAPAAGDDNLNTVPFVVSFSGGRALDSALSFPMFGALTAVFAHGEDMTT